MSKGDKKLKYIFTFDEKALDLRVARYANSPKLRSFKVRTEHSKHWTGTKRARVSLENDLFSEGDRRFTQG